MFNITLNRSQYKKLILSYNTQNSRVYRLRHRKKSRGDVWHIRRRYDHSKSMKNLTVTFTQCTLYLLPECYAQREGNALENTALRGASLLSPPVVLALPLITVHTIRTAAVLCLWLQLRSTRKRVQQSLYMGSRRTRCLDFLVTFVKKRVDKTYWYAVITVFEEIKWPHILYFKKNTRTAEYSLSAFSEK